MYLYLVHLVMQAKSDPKCFFFFLFPIFQDYMILYTVCNLSLKFFCHINKEYYSENYIEQGQHCHIIADKGKGLMMKSTC